ncbi:MAG: hypothetical protein M0P71_13825 [Melioribacteraceae bacterium]|nr:hypothetical protein [Melioribacteraceae bacterium]
MQLQDCWSLVQYFLIWSLCAVFVESLTEIIVNAGPLEGFRGFVARRGKILGIDFAELITCGYCCSVWVAFPISFFLPSFIFSDANFWDSTLINKNMIAFIDHYFYWILNWLVLHRLSNIIHIKLKPVKIDL